jgi:hypothetical protein
VRSALLVLVACGSKDPPAPRPVPREAALPDAAIDAPADAPIDAPLWPGLELRMLEGPYATIDAYCKDKPHIDEEGYATRCEQEPLWTGKRKLAAPAAPFEEARLFVVEGLDPHCQLGIRTGKRWYVLPEAVRCLGDRAKSSLTTKVTTFAIEDGRLVVDAVYDQSTHDYSPEDYEVSHFEIRILCGIGPSGAPSCTRELPIRGKHETHIVGQKSRKSDFALAWKLGADQIEVTGETSALEVFLIAPLAEGTYALRFP